MERLLVVDDLAEVLVGSVTRGFDLEGGVLHLEV